MAWEQYVDGRDGNGGRYEAWIDEVIQGQQTRCQGFRIYTYATTGAPNFTKIEGTQRSYPVSAYAIQGANELLNITLQPGESHVVTGISQRIDGPGFSMACG